MPVIINGSTGISGTDGTTSSPAVQGTDTNTGMWFPAADTIAFSEGGVEALRLNSSGNAIFSGTVRVGGIAADLYPLVLDTAKTATGAFVDFTGIPSWARRITVMLNGVSTNGTSNYLIQLGSGSVTTTGYVSSGTYVQGAVGSGSATSTAGVVMFSGAAANVQSGHVVFTLIAGNSWIASGVTCFDNQAINGYMAGRVALSGALDRVRITTVNGTDLFDAGSVNVMWEG
jgi:hypothetical protein